MVLSTPIAGVGNFHAAYYNKCTIIVSARSWQTIFDYRSPPLYYLFATCIFMVLHTPCHVSTAQILVAIQFNHDFRLLIRKPDRLVYL